MKILFIVSRSPDKNGQADQFTTWHAIQYLRNNGCKVDCVVLEPYSFFSPFFYLKAFLNLFKGLPLQYSLYDSENNKIKVLKKYHNDDYEKIYFHLIRSMPASHIIDVNENIYLGMQISQGLNFRRISKEMSFGIKKYLYFFESILCKHYEIKLCHKKHKINFVGTQDPEFLDVSKLQNITIIPHGVDLYEINPISKNKDLIFLANFASEANKEALECLIKDIFPVIQIDKPNIQLTIAGHNIPKKYNHKKIKNINFIGFVKNPSETIAHHKIFLNPVRAAAGMQNKVVTALSSGTPVVTYINAIKGMQISSEFLVAVNNNDCDFAQEVIKMLNNYPSLESLNNLSSMISKEWSWDHLHKIWSQNFLEIN